MKEEPLSFDTTKSNMCMCEMLEELTVFMNLLLTIYLNYFCFFIGGGITTGLK